VADTEAKEEQQPFLVKLVRDEKGKPKWGNILLMLAITAASAYLSAASHRAGSDIDFNSHLQMKIALAQQNLGRQLTKLGDSLYDKGCVNYDRVRPL
jgi:hypothetical protein